MDGDPIHTDSKSMGDSEAANVFAEFILLAHARAVVSVSRGRHSSSFADVARVAANPHGDGDGDRERERDRDGRIGGEHEPRMKVVAARAAFPPPTNRTQASPECKRFGSGERRATIKVWWIG